VGCLHRKNARKMTPLSQAVPGNPHGGHTQHEKGNGFFAPATGPRLGANQPSQRPCDGRRRESVFFKAVKIFAFLFLKNYKIATNQQN
jgi:hypothetical protein